MMRAALLLALSLFSAPLAATASGTECERRAYDGARFAVCKVDLAQDTLRLWLNGADGKPLGSFHAVNQLLRDSGQQLGVAMNAGMYHMDRAPVGLYIEDGREEMRVITSDGPGNFGLLPNGVLCMSDGTASVIESRRYAKAPPACRFATQSGPMLVIDGDLHPKFLKDSDSYNVRNGVGVSADGGTLWMAISEVPVNFHHFARFFRDDLGTPNALYLDGNVSRLYAPDLGRRDPGLPMGPILGTAVPAN